jgi:hypothetical protein
MYICLASYYFNYLIFILFIFIKSKGRINYYVSKIYNIRNELFYFRKVDIQSILSKIDKKKIQSDAQLIYSHIFDILGSGQYRLDKKIRWHCDFKSARVWPLNFHKKLRIVLNDKSDIKVVWELSRFHHLVILGIAYNISCKNEYFEEFKNQIENWIEQNPIAYGPNWCVSMEVAIRAINLVMAYHLFGDKNNAWFWIKYDRILYLHGLYIFNNLEKRITINGEKVNNNHYLANIVGLIFLGNYFFFTRKGKKWKKFAIKEFYKEIENQILEDGGDFESSSGYQRLVTELVSCGLILLVVNREPIPFKIIERWEKMFEFIDRISKPNGFIPAYGDDDDGRILVFSNYFNWERLNLEYLLVLGAKLFNEQFSINDEKNNQDYTTWLTYKLTINGRLPIFKEKKVIPKQSIELSKSGFYVMRKNDHYMLITAAPIRQHSHNHNDLFGFEIFFHNQSVLIDPGTYNYSGDIELRNLFRSTKFHNTIQVENNEINSFRGSLFGLNNDSHHTINEWISNHSFDLFEGVHTGFKVDNLTAEHRRKIYFSKRGHPFWVIYDTVRIICSKDNNRLINVKQYFHIHPDLMFRQCFTNEIDISKYKNALNDMKISFTKNIIDSSIQKNILFKNGKPFFTIQQLLVDHLSYSEENGLVSKRYGIKEQSSILIFHKIGLSPLSYITILEGIKN